MPSTPFALRAFGEVLVLGVQCISHTDVNQRYLPMLNAVCRKMGLNSLPVAFGPEVAKWITVATIDVTQIAVAAYLAVGRHETTYAAVLTALILPQVILTGVCLP